MVIRVLTIFPELFDAFWDHGMIRRAITGRCVDVGAVNIRDFTDDRHRTTDDRPYGGGPGMVMKPEPLARAIRSVTSDFPAARTVLLSPQGRVFHHTIARELAAAPGLILVCGRYEGVDDRIGDHLVDDVISIGDYVLSGGEVAAMVIIDAITRLIPGVLGGADSAEKESFSENLIEHAHFTRPREFEGEAVPEVLLSGDHQAIDAWRLETSVLRTLSRRPDLLTGRPLDAPTVRILKKWYDDIDTILRDQPVGRTDPSSGSEPER